MAAKHMLGAIHIIQEAGGVDALGLTDLVRYIIHSCIHGKGLPDWEPALLPYSSTFVEPNTMRI